MPLQRSHVQGGDNYVVAHNNNNIWHLVLLNEGQIVSTGQDEISTFTNLEDAISFVPEEYRQDIWTEELIIQ